jgi:hypothetical protein
MLDVRNTKGKVEKRKMRERPEREMLDVINTKGKGRNMRRGGRS